MIVIHPDSTNIHHVVYDEVGEYAIVKFNSGRAYIYRGVTKDMIAALIVADSFGSKFNELFVGENRRVSSTQEIVF